MSGWVAVLGWAISIGMVAFVIFLIWISKLLTKANKAKKNNEKKN